MESLNQTLGSPKFSSIPDIAMQAFLSDANLNRHKSSMPKAQLVSYDVYPLTFSIKM